ncbi:MAG: PBP1A family penicillin-binding protein [Rickettsiales bacterium]
MSFLKFIFRSIIFLAIASVCLVGFIIVFYSNSLPDVKILKDYRPELVSKIYASNGQLLEEYAEEYRLFTPIDHIPKQVIYAFLAAEDADFYDHIGVDPSGLARAITQNIKNYGKKKSLIGGSTITQQVIKNLLLSNEKSFERKIKEAILSLRLEEEMEKDQILELYLNHIFLGNRAYGVTSAASRYFNKSIEDLTLDEIALLASLPKAPSYYNPKKHPKRILDRRNWVLRQMLEKKFITQDAYEEAISKPINISNNKKDIYHAGYFSNEVRNIISNQYGQDSLFIDGLIINTSIIPKLQTAAQNSFRKSILAYDKKIKEERLKEEGYAEHSHPTPEINGGMVVINNQSGKVVSLVGGYDFSDSQFNRVTQATRQTGSIFKSFVYLTALENSFSPASTIEDLPTAISQGRNSPEWLPKNYSDDFLGKITLRKGLELSRNVATVNLANKLGIKKISDLSKTIGVIKSPLHNLSAVLGANETTLINIASGYATIANGGKKINPVLIETIQERSGKIIYKNPSISCEDCFNEKKLPTLIDHKEQIVSKESAFQLTNILAGAVKRGTSKRARVVGLNIAGKTGTTNDNKDAWFVGFTPEYTIGIYVGYDAPQSLGKKATGANVALPIFVDFIKNNKWFFKDRPFKTPNGIKMIRVDYDTGMLPNESTRRTIFEAFKRNQTPGTLKETSNSKEIDLLLESGQIY